MKPMRCFAITLITVFAASILPASAKQIAAFKDWSAHSEGKSKARTCWIYSEPVKDEGKYKKRGRIYLLVTHRPGEKTFNQVQFTAGYTYKKGSAVQVAVGAKKFELFTNGDTAWARSTNDDKDIVAAMRGGARMVVTGQSSRGTKTKDTYSLSGISAAHKAIGKACGVK
ncbi:MAG: hypothetical protein ACI9JL_003178 [Paracoccaceae bacterium]|jgi:hypothetical protein